MTSNGRSFPSVAQLMTKVKAQVSDLQTQLLNGSELTAKQLRTAQNQLARLILYVNDLKDQIQTQGLSTTEVENNLNQLYLYLLQWETELASVNYGDYYSTLLRTNLATAPNQQEYITRELALLAQEKILVNNALLALQQWERSEDKTEQSVSEAVIPQYQERLQLIDRQENMLSNIYPNAIQNARALHNNYLLTGGPNSRQLITMNDANPYLNDENMGIENRSPTLPALLPPTRSSSRTPPGNSNISMSDL